MNEDDEYREGIGKSVYLIKCLQNNIRSVLTNCWVELCIIPVLSFNFNFLIFSKEKMTNSRKYKNSAKIAINNQSFSFEDHDLKIH